MLLDFLESFDSIIKSWRIDEFESAGPNLKLKGIIYFKDKSTLYFKQIVLEGSKFKYAYHWENKNGDLICRWDNAPHWPNVKTYPHHKHMIVGLKEVVKESKGGDFEAVLREISKKPTNQLTN